MDAFKDALRGALADQDALIVTETAEEPAAPGEDAPDPHDSDWVRCLRRHVEVPGDAGVARLRQLSDVQVKELKSQGRKREARELADLRDDWLRKADRRAWAEVKQRFAELELPEKAYRALKQQPDAQPERILQRLRTRAAEELRGASAKRVREWLDA